MENTIYKSNLSYIHKKNVENNMLDNLIWYHALHIIQLIKKNLRKNSKIELEDNFKYIIHKAKKYQKNIIISNKEFITFFKDNFLIESVYFLATSLVNFLGTSLINIGLIDNYNVFSNYFINILNIPGIKKININYIRYIKKQNLYSNEYLIKTLFYGIKLNIDELLPFFKNYLNQLSLYLTNIFSDLPTKIILSYLSPQCINTQYLNIPINNIESIYLTYNITDNIYIFRICKNDNSSVGINLPCYPLKFDNLYIYIDRTSRYEGSRNIYIGLKIDNKIQLNVQNLFKIKENLKKKIKGKINLYYIYINDLYRNNIYSY